MNLANQNSNMSDEFNDMVRRYGAEELPTEVSNVLLEYFLKKPVPEVNNVFVTVDDANNSKIITLSKHFNNLRLCNNHLF